MEEKLRKMTDKQLEEFYNKTKEEKERIDKTIWK